MAGELRTYDPDTVTALWVISTTGQVVDMTQGLIAGAGAISEAKTGARWTRRTDRQGNAVRNRNRARDGAVTFTYVAEAEIHAVLDQIMTLDDQLGNQVGTLVIKDLSGQDLITFAGAYIEDDPAINYGDTAADRAYVIGFAERLPELKGTAVL